MITEPRSAGTASATPLRDAWPALTALSAVFLFEMLDNSILNIALPTIGRDLRASTTDLQWVTGAYSMLFGGLMMLFGAVADRFGRRRVMLIGLALLALASAATVLVTSPAQLIAVRALIGIAAAMTTPGSMALAFRLFDAEELRVRALTIISTAGLVGLAVGPTAGGLVLAIAPWQVLLLVNVPIAVLAFIGIRVGIAAEAREDLHTDRVDVAGAVLGTLAIIGALATGTVFIESDGIVWAGWLSAALTVVFAVGFVVRERSATQPLFDAALLRRPLVASGLVFKAASALAVSGLSFMVTLQLQFAWGWPPALAAIGMLPQVIVLLAGGRLVAPFVKRVGLVRAAWMSASAVVAGLGIFAAGSRFGYGWVLLALVLVSAGMRVVGVVAGANVLTGLPADRASIGAAFVDVSGELASGAGIAATGTILALLVSGSIATTTWTAARLVQFQDAITTAGLTLTVLAGALVFCGIISGHRRIAQIHSTE